MKLTFRIVSIVVWVLIWCHAPYSYKCSTYVLAGCDGSEFFWNIPYDDYDYNKIKWGSYFMINIFLTIMSILLIGGLAKAIEGRNASKTEVSN